TSTHPNVNSTEAAHSLIVSSAARNLLFILPNSHDYIKTIILDLIDEHPHLPMPLRSLRLPLRSSAFRLCCCLGSCFPTHPDAICRCALRFPLPMQGPSG